MHTKNCARCMVHEVAFHTAALTNNKSHEKTLDKIGIYLPKPFFSHSQFYVAVSRVTSRKGLKILARENGTASTETRNIVYQEVLAHLQMHGFTCMFFYMVVYVLICKFPFYPRFRMCSIQANMTFMLILLQAYLLSERAWVSHSLFSWSIRISLRDTCQLPIVSLLLILCLFLLAVPIGPADR